MIDVGISSVEGSVCSVLPFFFPFLFPKGAADTKASGYPKSTCSINIKIKIIYGIQE